MATRQLITKDDPRIAGKTDGRVHRLPRRGGSGFPTDPIVAERLRWVAHYAVLGWGPSRINAALKQHIRDQTKWVTDEQVRLDLKLLVRLNRQEALADASTIFTKLYTRLDHIAGTAIEDYRQGIVPRRVQTPDGEMVIPALTPTERAALLKLAIHATAAQHLMAFGTKGGGSVVVNVDARSQSLSVEAKAADSQKLRELAAETRRQIAADRRPPKGKPIIDITAGNDAEDDLAADLDALVQDAGVTGSTNAADQWDDES